MLIPGPFLSLLGQVWDDFNRIHHGGLGESPRGLADYRRNRWIVAALLALLGAAGALVWFVCRP